MQKGKGGRWAKEEGGKRRKVGKGGRWEKEEGGQRRSHMGMGLEMEGVNNDGERGKVCEAKGSDSKGRTREN